MYYSKDMDASTITFDWGMGEVVVAFADVADTFNEAMLCSTGLYGDYYAAMVYVDDADYDYCGEAGYGAEGDTCLKMYAASCEMSEYGYYTCEYNTDDYYFLPMG